MEVIIVFAVVFVVGYAVGRARSRRIRRMSEITPPAGRPTRTSSHRPSTSRGYSSREREYGGFGALGATNDPGDFGDAGP